MRHKLKHIPKVPLPKGRPRLEPFTDATAQAFAQAFRASPSGTSVSSRGHASDEERLDFVRGSSAFRPVTSPGRPWRRQEPVGLVILDGAWIDQVGASIHLSGAGGGSVPTWWSARSPPP